MALKAVLATQADFDAYLATLPDASREYVKTLYALKNGKFYLDAENVDHEGALARALEGERGTAAGLKRQLADLTAKLGDLDPEKAREALAQLRKLQEQTELGEVPETLRPTFDKLFATRTERMKSDYEAQIAAVKTQLDKATGEQKTLFGQLKTLTVNGAIRDLAAKKGVWPEHFEDVVTRMTISGIDGVKWDLVDGKVLALDEAGNIKYGKVPPQPMSFEEGFALLAERAPRLFQPSGGAGANNLGGAGSNVVGGKLLISPEDAKNPQKYRAAKEQAQKAGLELAEAGA